jgi:hypothetical protein
VSAPLGNLSRGTLRNGVFDTGQLVIRVSGAMVQTSYLAMDPEQIVLSSESWFGTGEGNFGLFHGCSGENVLIVRNLLLPPQAFNQVRKPPIYATARIGYGGFIITIEIPYIPILKCGCRNDLH